MREFWCVRQPGFRAYAMRLDGMNFDAARFKSGHARAGFATDLTLVLEGQWVDRRDGERRLGAGELTVGPAAKSPSDRWLKGSRLVTLEWNEPGHEALTQQKVSAPTVERARAFARALEPRQPTASPRMVEALQSLLEALRGEDVVVPHVEPSPPPEEAVRAADMLNRALTQLDDAPMLVDFCSERSERQWRRDLRRAADWIGLIGGSFRATLNTVRLSAAVSLLDVPGVTLAEVARALGYTTEKSLAQALRRAGIALTPGA